MSNIKLYQGDCLEIMKNIPNNSIDCIICDLPYGTTSCSWDIIIPFDKLWEQYKRIAKDTTPIILFGTEPFSSHLRLSNEKMYKYDLYWQKEKLTNVFLVKKQFGRVIENISVFYKKQPTYNPQMEKRKNVTNPHPMKNSCGSAETNVYCGDYKHSKDYNPNLVYPINVLKFSRESVKGVKSLHPTQKPLELIEYLIKTYSNEGDIILDNCMGSGTTGVACKHLHRNFIGIEKDENYFKIAKK